MKTVYIRFYAELNNFIQEKYQFKRFRYSLPDNDSILKIIDRFDIPLENIDLILCDNKSVNKFHVPDENSKISFYPVFEKFDIDGLSKIRENSLRNTKFIVDVHLKKTAKYLRFLGFDSLYSNRFDDEEIINISLEEKRIIISGDRDLINDSRVERGLLIVNNILDKKLRKIIKYFQLEKDIKLFSRCMVCNTVLKKIDPRKYNISNYLIENHKCFKKCENCNKIYWKGSHYRKMKNKINKILRSI